MTNLDTLDIYEEHEGLRAISPAKVLKIAKERDEYKIWWERDSKSLGTALNDLSLERACKQDRLSQIERQKGRIEQLQKALDNRSRQLGIQPSDHEPTATVGEEWDKAKAAMSGEPAAVNTNNPIDRLLAELDEDASDCKRAVTSLPGRAAATIRLLVKALKDGQEPEPPVVCRQCGSTDTMPWPTSPPHPGPSIEKAFARSPRRVEPTVQAAISTPGPAVDWVECPKGHKFPSWGYCQQCYPNGEPMRGP